MTRRALAVIVTAALLAPVSPAHADVARRIETERTERPVAPGVTLSSFDGYEADGWVQVGCVDPGTVAQAVPLSEQTPRAVAAINGDFFDIDNSDAPEGVGVQDGRLRKSGEGRAAASARSRTASPSTPPPAPASRPASTSGPRAPASSPA